VIKKEMPLLKVGEFVAKVPIIQGGMSVGVSLAGLASAVANEGGIGVIGAAAIGMFEEDFEKNFKEANRRALRKEIRKAKERTNGLIGVNVLMALTDADGLIKVAAEEKSNFVFLGAGLPLKLPEEVTPDGEREPFTKVVPIVSSARATRIIFEYWSKNYGNVPSMVVVEGPMAGGHLGFKKEQIDDPNYALENIFPPVLEVVKRYEKKFNKQIPAIAAGGIFNGADICKFLSMGASGVQMGTRFVATYECDASDKFKEMYVKCKKEDLKIIKSPVGLPGRAIRNKFIEDVEKGVKKPFKCPWKCLKTCDFRTSPYCIARALTNAKIGRLEDGFTFAGANAYRINKIVSVKELISELKTEYEESCEESKS
jgi:nitronate monooxygenase